MGSMTLLPMTFRMMLNLKTPNLYRSFRIPWIIKLMQLYIMALCKEIIFLLHTMQPVYESLTFPMYRTLLKLESMTHTLILMVMEKITTIQHQKQTVLGIYIPIYHQATFLFLI